MAQEVINTIHKKIKPTVATLAEGTRQNLHPKLAILDEIKSRVVYDKGNKCIFVDYDYDESTGLYNKGIYTTSFQQVVDEIEEFIDSHVNIQ